MQFNKHCFVYLFLNVFYFLTNMYIVFIALLVRQV